MKTITWDEALDFICKHDGVIMNLSSGDYQIDHRDGLRFLHIARSRGTYSFSSMHNPAVAITDDGELLMTSDGGSKCSVYSTDRVKYQ